MQAEILEKHQLTGLKEQVRPTYLHLPNAVFLLMSIGMIGTMLRVKSAYLLDEVPMSLSVL